MISSERGQIYSFATPKLQPILVNEASKTLIEQCLNAPDPIAPLALGMPGQQMPMLPIDGSIDPNDPNQQQYAEQYADGSYAEGQHPDADQLLAMQQVRSKRGRTGGVAGGGGGREGHLFQKGDVLLEDGPVVLLLRVRELDLDQRFLDGFDHSPR